MAAPTLATAIEMPVGRGEQGARDRPVSPLAADADHREDHDEEAAGVGGEHVHQNRLLGGLGEHGHEARD
jgi:hypothetical protein